MLHFERHIGSCHLVLPTYRCVEMNAVFNQSYSALSTILSYEVINEAKALEIRWPVVKKNITHCFLPDVLTTLTLTTLTSHSYFYINKLPFKL